VHQPAGGDWNNDRLGWVNNTVPLAGNGAWNWADMASIAIERHDLVTSTHPVINTPLRGHYEGLGKDWQLWKVGAKSGYTQGRVRATDHTASAIYDDGSPGGVKILFKDQVMIEGENTANPSMPGDSGALWVTMDHFAAALNMGSSPGFAYASRIQTVLGTWRMQIWGGTTRDGSLLEVETAESDEIVTRPNPRAIEELRARTISSEAPVEEAPVR
jgi:hypothetical protein